jgi:nitroreductase
LTLDFSSRTIQPMTENPDDRLKLIFGRRSIRQYAPGEVSQQAVTRLLEAAMAAPSAMTKDPWRFVVVRDRQKLASMATILPGGGMLATASLAVLVCGDIDAAFERQLGFLLQDCSAAIENLLLAAHALGLGACWVGVHPHQGSANRMKEMFSLPASLVPVAVISVGLPAEQPEPRTRYNPDYVRFEKW